MPINLPVCVHDVATTPTTDDAVNASPDVVHFALAAHAPATRRAYAAALRDWEHWSSRHARQYLPAQEHDVAEYLAATPPAGRGAASLARRVAAPAVDHRPDRAGVGGGGETR